METDRQMFQIESESYYEVIAGCCTR